MTTNHSHPDSGRLPPIHIMAGGIYALPYARFAAECLWQKCPQALRKELDVTIGLFAVPASVINEATAFLKEVPCVSVLLNPVRIPMRIFDLPQGYTRHRIQKVLGLIRKFFDNLGLPPTAQIRLCPVVYAHLVHYHQEYFVRVCSMGSKRETICVVDGDFFVWDEMFFDKLLNKQGDGIFASGWLQRTNDGATFKGATVFPVGTECVRLRPEMFNKYNRQTFSMDQAVYKQLEMRYSGVNFQQRMVDTIYQVCWEAQFEGLKIDYPFSDLKVCHVGGFGHANASYIKDGIHRNDEKHARFWIQRIRLNERVAETLARRFSKSRITAGLENIHQRTRPIWEDETIRNLETRTPPSGDEKLFEEIAIGLQNSSPSANKKA